MTELSREAMALLELSPTWQRRERYQDTPIAIQPRGRGVLIALVASDDATRALWQKMISVLVGIGFPRAVFEQSIVVEAAQADALAHRLRTQRPAALMIMGDALLQA
ncbi:MAG: hypothetical protein FGM18_02820, partial [Burkholderiaceae bacterium]|nr:hypothetical protein [Burkholderiaceae bacterium]